MDIPRIGAPKRQLPALMESAGTKKPGKPFLKNPAVEKLP